MTTYIIVAIVIIALLFIPFVRAILRWIVFLPIALLLGLLYQFLDIPALILTWILSKISPILGLIFNAVDIFMGFFIVTFVSGKICPSSKIGWCIAFTICLLLSFFNLKDYHVYVLFPLGVRDPGAPTPAIIWWHIVILVVSSFVGGFAGRSEDS